MSNIHANGIIPPIVKELHVNVCQYILSKTVTYPHGAGGATNPTTMFDGR